MKTTLFLVFLYLGMSAALVSASEEKVHHVRSGDTLWKIARQYGTTLEKLKSANGLKSDLIIVGSKILIPKHATKAPPQARTHKVKPGQTLCSISRQHGVTVRQLCLWNSIGDPGKLRSGQIVSLVGENLAARKTVAKAKAQPAPKSSKQTKKSHGWTKPSP